MTASSRQDSPVTNPGVRGRQAERSDATRRRLLGAARALFAERGYDATPVEEILSRTDLSKGAFYHHFPDKRELLAAVYEEVEQELTAMLAGAGRELPDPIERIDRGCQAFLDACLDPTIRRIALVEAPAVLGWRRWREIDARHGFGLLLAGMRSAARAGRIPADHLVERGHLLLAALMEAALLVGASSDPAGTRRAAGRIISEQVWGLAGEPPPSTDDLTPPVFEDTPPAHSPADRNQGGEHHAR